MQPNTCPYPQSLLDLSLVPTVFFLRLFLSSNQDQCHPPQDNAAFPVVRRGIYINEYEMIHLIVWMVLIMPASKWLWWWLAGGEEDGEGEEHKDKEGVGGRWNQIFMASNNHNPWIPVNKTPTQPNTRHPLPLPIHITLSILSTYAVRSFKPAPSPCLGGSTMRRLCGVVNIYMSMSISIRLMVSMIWGDREGDREDAGAGEWGGRGERDTDVDEEGDSDRDGNGGGRIYW